MPKFYPELNYWLALLRAPGVGPITFHKLTEIFPQLSDLFAVAPQELAELKISPALIAYLQKPAWQAVANDLAWAQQAGNFILTIKDPHYPTWLQETAGAPSILFVRGKVQALQNRQIALVGSRNPSKQGLETAFAFAQQLAKAGLTITSGLALGIDAASHRGALAAGGTTIAVMGTGLDQIYPARHQELAEQIVAAGGALVSEFPPGTAPKAENFPRRNRIINGLSVGVLVIEAALRSGSLITAKYALEQGREVFAVPGSIHNPLARGCHALLRQGAKLVESTEDVLEELNLPLVEKKIERQIVQNLTHGLEYLDSEQAKLVECVGFDVSSIDMLVARSGLSAEVLLSKLLLLELNGYIKAVPGGYSLSTRPL